MDSLSFQIRKADHPNPNSTYDLHVHVYMNAYRRGRRLLGRYRLPTLEPVFPRERELTSIEIEELAGWLRQPAQIRKLQNCLDDTVFDMHKVAKISPRFGQIIPEGGETYINIRIPISKRIQSTI